VDHRLSEARAKRVVVIHSSDEMYGADRVTLQVAEALQSMDGVELEVWLPNDVAPGPTPLSHHLAARGVTVRHLELPMLRRALLTPRGLVEIARRAQQLRACLRHHGADLVYLTTSACLPAAPVARAAGVDAVVLHMQELWAGRERAILGALAKATTTRIAISSAVDRASGLRDPHPVVIPNTVAKPTVVAPPLCAEGRPGGLRYVVASRWTPRKGYGTLLDAWSLAGCPGHLTILGGAPPSGRAVDVPALVEQVARPETVTVIGEVADIAPYIAEADVVLLPSDEPEGFGLVPIEGFAQGRPAIASRAGGVVDVITHGIDGWLFTPKDAASLAAVFESLTPELVTAAGERARSAYNARHTPERFTTQIQALIAEALCLEAPVLVSAPAS